MLNLDYQLVKQLFFAAAPLETGEREDFLAAACAGERPLLEEVRSLLHSWNEAPDFLAPGPLTPASASLGGELAPGFDLKFLLRHWDRYELERCLGVGSRSLVYRAIGRCHRRPVAIKFLTHPGRRTLARFRREAEVQSRISHPAVLELYETGSADGIPFLAMRLVNGPDLMGIRAMTGFEDKADLVRQVALGLQAAHDLGIVHRDVKPSNVLVERRGGALRAVLVDFGIARDRETAAVTATGRLIGTVPYLPPERLRRPADPHDPRSDVYALGVTFYELLTGHTPHGSGSTLDTLLRIRDGDIIPPRAELSELPRRLEDVLLRSLATEPAARYPSAAALADDLENFLRADEAGRAHV